MTRTVFATALVLSCLVCSCTATSKSLQAVNKEFGLIYLLACFRLCCQSVRWLSCCPNCSGTGSPQTPGAALLIAFPATAKLVMCSHCCSRREE